MISTRQSSTKRSTKLSFSSCELLVQCRNKSVLTSFHFILVFMWSKGLGFGLVLMTKLSINMRKNWWAIVLKSDLLGGSGQLGQEWPWHHLKTAVMLTMQRESVCYPWVFLKSCTRLVLILDLMMYAWKKKALHIHMFCISGCMNEDGISFLSPKSSQKG